MKKVLLTSCRGVATVLILLLGASGCHRDGDSGKGGSNGAEITFENAEGRVIVGTLYAAKANRPPGVILIHEAGRTRASWGDLGARLQAQGYSCIALDLGGHGDSADSDFEFRNFDDASWVDRADDVRAAAQALVAAGCDPNNLAVIGAGFGASLGLLTATEGAFQSVVLVSPILESHGLRVKPLIDTAAEIPVLILTAEGDAQSAAAGRQLKEAAYGFCELRVYPGSLHGTDLTSGSESAAAQIMQWLEQTLPAAHIP